MASKQPSQLHSEMEKVRNLWKLSEGERRKELQKETFRELREMEMERQARADQEAVEKRRREQEERDKAAERLRREKERLQEERRRQEAKRREEEKAAAGEVKALEEQRKHQLEQERRHWLTVMKVEEKPITGSRFMVRDLKEEQQSRYREAELCRLRKEEDRARSKCLLKAQQRRQIQFNNWAGNQRAGGEPDETDLHPNGRTNTPPSERVGLECEKTPRSSESLLWQKVKLGLGPLLEKYRDELERKREARRLKAEEQYSKWTASKERQHFLSKQFDCYTEGFNMSRNSILKKAFR
ncbi:golgin subfamily A member 6-like protein 22 [Labrus mixtus]|uniref:golgin subfamily A member 6-like protein 22 n=1 Tax=Labrus mixtus TaxID=508554 RepID=UPI0029C070DA|nr:golgin subfamily A member 6-like protein 22 [Labrus mixtus]